MCNKGIPNCQAGSPPKKRGSTETLSGITTWNKCPEICEVKYTQKAFQLLFAGTKHLFSEESASYGYGLVLEQDNSFYACSVRFPIALPSNMQKESRCVSKSDIKSFYAYSIVICIYFRETSATSRFQLT